LVVVDLDQDILLQVQEHLVVVLLLLEQHPPYQQPVVVAVVDLLLDKDQEDLEVQVVVVENVDVEQVLQVDVEHPVKEIQEDLTTLQELAVVVVNQHQEQQHQDQALVVEVVEQV
jgi:hypothetical protein